MLINLQMFKMYQLTFFLIPQPKGQGSKAGEEFNRFDLEDLVLLMAFFKQVIGYAGTEVVNMVKSNAAAEPLKDSGKLIERTAFQAGFNKIPFLGPFPIHTFKLMLDIKEPDSDCGSDPDHRKLDQDDSS